MSEQTGKATGPLAGLRVIEMGTLLAGPFCGQLLGDFGAEIIKIEPPGQGDPMRDWGQEKSHGMSLWWPVVARNKKSVTLNLREAAGQQIAKDLIAKSDFLLENFRPGTMEKLALRVSNAVALTMLFLIGWMLGKYSGMSRLRTGIAMLAIGLVLVAITNALGG